MGSEAKPWKPAVSTQEKGGISPYREGPKLSGEVHALCEWNPKLSPSLVPLVKALVPGVAAVMKSLLKKMGCDTEAANLDFPYLNFVSAIEWLGNLRQAAPSESPLLRCSTYIFSSNKNFYYF